MVVISRFFLVFFFTTQLCAMQPQSESQAQAESKEVLNGVCPEAEDCDQKMLQKIQQLSIDDQSLSDGKKEEKITYGKYFDWLQVEIKKMKQWHRDFSEENRENIAQLKFFLKIYVPYIFAYEVEKSDANVMIDALDLDEVSFFRDLADVYDAFSKKIVTFLERFKKGNKNLGSKKFQKKIKADQDKLTKYLIPFMQTLPKRIEFSLLIIQNDLEFQRNMVAMFSNGVQEKSMIVKKFDDDELRTVFMRRCIDLDKLEQMLTAAKSYAGEREKFLSSSEQS